MDLKQPLALLGGLSAQQFMKRHWQKKPLLVRQALPAASPPVSRAQLIELAGQEGVESRLVLQPPSARNWQLRHGPFSKRQLPPFRSPGWTLLVQGLDLHVDAARALLDRFRFVPEARLDDLMMSYATDGGGVGPHLDSYDVFLLQVHGRRRWRIGPVKDDRIIDGLPVRILENFHADSSWDLEPGDMLYLPPRWGHEGIALGECMTCSIGFRTPAVHSLASELLPRIAEALENGGGRYRDPSQAAAEHPGRIPEAMQAFAARAVQEALRRMPHERALGEWLTEPKPQVWFDAGKPLRAGQGVQLDRRTRMLYDARQVYINGESYRAAGTDARCLARLADNRQLQARELERLSGQARELLEDWALSGWLRSE